MKRYIPMRAGSPWSPVEDGKLRKEHAAGVSTKDIAVAHSRTKAGVEKRIEVLKLNQPQEGANG